MSASILLVTSDFAGLTKNGGIGTAFYHLASLLASQHYKVTVLYTHGTWVENSQNSFEEWQSEYERQDITVIPLPSAHQNPNLSPNASTSLRICEWLLTQEPFDCIHFHDWQGLSFFTLFAKHRGLAFTDIPIVIQAHSPTLWHHMNNGDPLDSIELLHINFMERLAVAYADYIISPSRYMLSWYEEQGWKTQAEQQVIPNNLAIPASPPAAPSPVSDIVFFGRQELRKGLGIFCDALELLQQEAPELLAHRNVTFLGKASNIEGEPSQEYISRRMKNLRISWRIEGNRNTHEAIAYLKSPGKLAVIASLLENSPYVVMEALAHGIPAIISASGGTGELIAPESHNITFHPNANALAARLKETLHSGARPGKLAYSLEDIGKSWLEFHQENIRASAASQKATPDFSVEALLQSTPLAKSNEISDALFFDNAELRAAFIGGMAKRTEMLALKNQGLEQENATLRRALSETLRSTSWKVTQPLRALRKWVG